MGTQYTKNRHTKVLKESEGRSHSPQSTYKRGWGQKWEMLQGVPPREEPVLEGAALPTQGQAVGNRCQSRWNMQSLNLWAWGGEVGRKEGRKEHSGKMRAPPLRGLASQRPIPYLEPSPISFSISEEGVPPLIQGQPFTCAFYKTVWCVYF